MLLAGCASHPAPRTSQAHVAAPTAARMPDGAGGSYKVGKPYRVGGRWYYPMQQAAGYDEVGIASWYGRDFHGRRTANGERYDMHALSAAHKTLPMPTLVRVTNLENGRSVIVRVNDRGPFARGRLIDLSYAAARQLGFVEKGTARVRVQTLDREPPSRASLERPAPVSLVPKAWAGSNNGLIYVQLGAFSSRVNAEQLRRRLSSIFEDVTIQPRQLASQTLYRVRIGPMEDMRRIEQTVRRLERNGYRNAVVIIE